MTWLPYIIDIWTPKNQITRCKFRFEEILNSSNCQSLVKADDICQNIWRLSIRCYTKMNLNPKMSINGASVKSFNMYLLRLSFTTSFIKPL